MASCNSARVNRGRFSGWTPGSKPLASEKRGVRLCRILRLCDPDASGPEMHDTVNKRVQRTSVCLLMLKSGIQKVREHARVKGHRLQGGSCQGTPFFWYGFCATDSPANSPSNFFITCLSEFIKSSVDSSPSTSSEEESGETDLEVENGHNDRRVYVCRA